VLTLVLYDSELIDKLDNLGGVSVHNVDEGDRRGINTSRFMQRVVDDIQRRFDGNALPLICVVWSDGTALTNRMSAHPVSLKVANVAPEAYQKRVRL